MDGQCVIRQQLLFITKPLHTEFQKAKALFSLLDKNKLQAKSLPIQRSFQVPEMNPDLNPDLRVASLPGFSGSTENCTINVNLTYM